MNNSIAVSNKPYSENITNSNTVYVYILDNPICSGKTTSLVQICLSEPGRKVYIAPSYQQLHRFIDELSKHRISQKIVVLKGKNKLCIREGIRFLCKRCPYRKRKYKLKAQSIIDENSVPKNVCPYFALLHEAKSADIILTTIHELYELFKYDNLPFNPSETILLVDEADLVMKTIYPFAIKLLEFEETEILDWVNVRRRGLLKLIDYTLSVLNLPDDYRQIFENILKGLNIRENVFTKALKFMPKIIAKPLLTIIIENTIKPLNEYLKGQWLDPPLELERTVLTSKSLAEDQKRLIIDLAWSLYWFKEVKIVHCARNPLIYEVWIVPYEGPKNKVDFILRFKTVSYTHLTLPTN